MEPFPKNPARCTNGAATMPCGKIASWDRRRVSAEQIAAEACRDELALIRAIEKAREACTKMAQRTVTIKRR